MKLYSLNSQIFANYASRFAQAATPAEGFAAAVAATSPATPASSTGSASAQPDFSSMTRQQMRDWANDQMRSGKISGQEGMTFAFMTLAVSAQTGQIIDAASDPVRIDFVQRARQGVEGALSRNDLQEANRLQTALATMLRSLAPKGDAAA